MTEPLTVLLGGHRVARLHYAGPASTGAALEYLPETVEKYGPGAIVLSVGLPVREEPYPAVEATFFLNGLLPESEVRAHLADRAKVSEGDTFGLLAHYGLDCAGAVQFIANDSADDREPSVRWLTDDELSTAVERLPSAPLGIQVSVGVRSSLGGAQGKLPLVVDGTRYGIPQDGYPSTHILKPARVVGAGKQEWPGIVAAEAFAMRVIGHIRRLGGALGAAKVKPVIVKDRPALLVERFDRTVGGSGMPLRIHQEDAAQALGIREKYQRFPDQPPRLVDIARMLQKNASAPVKELRVLYELAIVNAVLGNCDAHARNTSLALDEGQVSLTPAYDVVPTCIWPDHDRELALRIAGEVMLDDVRRENLLSEAKEWGMRAAVARGVLDETLERVEQAVGVTLSEARIEGWYEVVLEEVVKQARDRAKMYAKA